MASVEEMIKSSTCFGVAYDPNVKECKICEVRTKCKSKCETGNGELPKKPAAAQQADKSEVSMSEAAIDKSKDKEKAAAKKPAKPAASKEKEQYADDMPDFKTMSIDELLNLLKDKGGNPADFDKYTAENIKRMRITMALKKFYVVK